MPRLLTVERGVLQTGTGDTVHELYYVVLYLSITIPNYGIRWRLVEAARLCRLVKPVQTRDDHT